MSADFSFVEAIYREISDPRYADNPYIQAIPSLPQDRELLLALKLLPKFDVSERNWPNAERIQRLDLLTSLVIPLPRHVHLARSILKLMITGYGPRKPFSISQNEITANVYRMQQSGAFRSLHDAPMAAQLSMALFGISGSGKSYMIRQIAGMLPKVIFHPDLGKWQIPFLIVEMPHDGESSHTLATTIYEELDKLMPDGKYGHLYRQRNGQNSEERLMTALSILSDLGVGMLILDEAQNHRRIGKKLSARKEKQKEGTTSPNETKLTKLLITTSNLCHLPLMFVGTIELKHQHLGRFSRSRRMAGRGSAEWKALSMSGSLKDPGEYELFLMALFKYQWIRNPIGLTPEWVKEFFHFTQGIVDITVKLWESCQTHAISTGAETITPDLVLQVFENEFKATEYGIVALRDKDQLLLQAVSDLFDQADFESESDSLDNAQTAPLRKARSSTTKPASRKKGPQLAGPKAKDIAAAGLEIGTVEDQIKKAQEQVVSVPDKGY